MNTEYTVGLSVENVSYHVSATSQKAAWDESSNRVGKLVVANVLRVVLSQDVSGNSEGERHGSNGWSPHGKHAPTTPARRRVVSENTSSEGSKTLVVKSANSPQYLRAAGTETYSVKHGLAVHRCV